METVRFLVNLVVFQFLTLSINLSARTFLLTDDCDTTAFAFSIYSRCVEIRNRVYKKIHVSETGYVRDSIHNNSESMSISAFLNQRKAILLLCRPNISIFSVHMKFLSSLLAILCTQRMCISQQALYNRYR